MRFNIFESPDWLFNWLIIFTVLSAIGFWVGVLITFLKWIFKSIF